MVEFLLTGIVNLDIEQHISMLQGGELTEYSVVMASYRKANSENGSPSLLGDFFTI